MRPRGEGAPERCCTVLAAPARAARCALALGGLVEPVSTAAALRERLPELIEAIRAGSPIHFEDREALADFLALRLEAAEAQAVSARERSRERSAGIRRAILECYAGVRGRGLALATEAGLVGRRLDARPQYFGLKRGPSDRTIKEVLWAEMQKGCRSESETADVRLQTEGLPKPERG